MNAVHAYPLFDLQDPATALTLSSVRDHPVRLTSALAPSLLASYPLVNPSTEAYISPHSLLFSRDGARFWAGSESLLSCFDLSRPGNGPLTSLSTGARKGPRNADYGMSMKGLLSALAIDHNSGILAAGTFSRQVGLYGAEGQGDCVGVFSVEGTEADGKIGGRGLTQLIWSPCGRYLYIVERKSDGAMIYDIRNTGQLLGWLEGRKALTNQRIAMDVVRTSVDGHEVWGGGTDGTIRVWKNPHTTEGGQKADSEWHGHDGMLTGRLSRPLCLTRGPDAVSSAIVHSCGTVIVSTSGQRHFFDQGDDSGRVAEDILEKSGPGAQETVDNSLKVWVL